MALSDMVGARKVLSPCYGALLMRQVEAGHRGNPPVKLMGGKYAACTVEIAADAFGRGRACGGGNGVCRSGARSAQAVVMLQKEGFRDVANLAGGMLRWRAEGCAVEGGSE